MSKKMAVRCPWCNGEMEPDRSYKSIMAPGVGRTFWYFCDPCGAVSPRCDSPESAYAAAMRRYVEANRVLTWEEFLALPNKMLACREYRGDERYSPCHMWEGYGKTWRAWLRRPTDAERELTAWRT